MRLSFWDILASMVMLAGLALATIFLNIFFNPYTFINPFPPPTPVAGLRVPTLTPSPRSLPELWTATPETPDFLIDKSATPSVTVTQTGTRLVLPSATSTRTRTASPSPSKSVTNTPNRTLTSAGYRTSTYTATSVPASTSTPVTPTATQVPCITTSGYCDDANPNVIYTGTWTYYYGSGPWNSTSHYSDAVGATASYTFTGTRIVYVYPMFYNRGHARISIDGVPVAEISLYSPTLVWQQMWDSGTIANALHTIVITVVDGTIDLDAFIVNYGGAAIITPPTVTTNSATGVVATGATLHGTVNANSYSTVVTFEYGLTTAYGSTATAAESPVTGGANNPVSAVIGALTPGSTYHYRAVGVNAGGTTYGSDLTFATPKADQAALVVVDPSPVVYGTTAALSTTGGSGTGLVTFSVGSSTGCSVVGTTLSVIDVSLPCAVTATKAADANYNSATSAAQSVTLQKANQAALVVVDPSPVVYGTTPTLSTTGGSGTGAVTYSHGASTDCSVAGTTLTVINVGPSCDITATKATDNNYNAISSAALPVTLQKANQATLSVVDPSPVVYGTTPTLSTTGGSGTGAVTFSEGASSGCTVAGTTLTVTDASGTCVITATKAADTNYNLATSAALPVTLQKANQAALSVVDPSPASYAASPITVSTGGGSGTGAVTFDVGASTGCSVATNQLTIINSDGSGTCSLSATKAADNNYNLVNASPITVTMTP